MVRLRHIAGGMQGKADGLQRRRGLELVEPVLGQVVDGLEGRHLEVVVMLVPVRTAALAVMRLGAVVVLGLQAAVVQVDHGVPVDIADAAVDLVVAVVVAPTIVAVAVALAAHVDEVPVGRVVDQRRRGIPYRGVFVTNPPAAQAGVLEIIHIVGGLAENLPGPGLGAGRPDIELVGPAHLGAGIGRVHEGEGILDDVLVRGLRPGSSLTGRKGQA